MLVELSVMEQRYQAVLAVIQDGWKVTEVSSRLLELTDIVYTSGSLEEGGTDDRAGAVTGRSETAGDHPLLHEGTEHARWLADLIDMLTMHPSGAGVVRLLGEIGASSG